MPNSTPDVMPPPGIAAFFETWKLYQSIIQNNCMEHREIGEAVRNVFASLTADFSVLDLGCGDSSMALDAIEGIHVASYTGVDLTAPALDIARANFKGGYTASWVHANMVDYVAMCGRQFDVILTSFAMHHLPAATKQKWIADIAKCITPGGRLILIDTCCPAGMSRDETVQSYLDLIADWPLSNADKVAIAAHMWSSDYPESEAFLKDILASAGLVTDVMYRHGAGLQVGYLCRKTSA